MEKTLYRLDVTIPEPSVPLATAFFCDKVPYGWEEQDLATGATLFKLHVEDPAECAALVAEFAARFPGLTMDCCELPLRDWTVAWREFFTAVLCGEDFVVLAPWMLAEHPYRDRIAIVIEPKTAFGTGHHATTAICLEAISDLHRKARIDPSMRFLDLGAGSGILGLGLAKLGLSGLGLDIDPLAVENANENKTLNTVGEAFQVEVGGVEVAKGQQFEIVVANILAEPLISLAADICELLAPGGCLILSGLLALQVAGVTEAYTSRGFPEPKKILRDEWAALVWA